MQNHLENAPMLKKVQLIFGLGTGRCGTYSLTRLLNSHGVHATHEVAFLDWKPQEMQLTRNLDMLIARQTDRAADVGFYYLNYVEFILSLYHDAKFVCLKRDKGATVKSWNLHSGRSNHWTDPASEHWKEYFLSTATGDYFPKYDLPKKESIARFWDEYYAEAERLEARHPNFRIFDVSALDGGTEILDFIGIPKEEQHEQVYHMNRTNDVVAEQIKLPIKVRPCPVCNAPGSVLFVHDKAKKVVTWACGRCKQSGDEYNVTFNEKGSMIDALQLESQV